MGLGDEGVNTMTPAHLTSRIRRRPVKLEYPHSPLFRQWQLLQWLSCKPEGVTVGEVAKVTGMSLKTIRRDLILLRELGFDLEELVEERGRKRWRVRQPFERLRSKKQQYQAIREGELFNYVGKGVFRKRKKFLGQTMIAKTSRDKMSACDFYFLFNYIATHINQLHSVN